MSTWPSDGRQEKEREEVLAEMATRLLTAAGPEEEKIRLGSECAFTGGSFRRFFSENTSFNMGVYGACWSL